MPWTAAGARAWDYSHSPHFRQNRADPERAINRLHSARWGLGEGTLGAQRRKPPRPGIGLSRGAGIVGTPLHHLDANAAGPLDVDFFCIGRDAPAKCIPLVPPPCFSWCQSCSGTPSWSARPDTPRALNSILRGAGRVARRVAAAWLLIRINSSYSKNLSRLSAVAGILLIGDQLPVAGRGSATAAVGGFFGSGRLTFDGFGIQTLVVAQHAPGNNLEDQECIPGLFGLIVLIGRCLGDRNVFHSSAVRESRCSGRF